MGPHITGSHIDVLTQAVRRFDESSSKLGNRMLWVTIASVLVSFTSLVISIIALAKVKMIALGKDTLLQLWQ